MDQFSIHEEECIAEERAIEAARLGAAITTRPIRQAADAQASRCASTADDVDPPGDGG